MLDAVANAIAISFTMIMIALVIRLYIYCHSRIPDWCRGHKSLDSLCYYLCLPSSCGGNLQYHKTEIILFVNAIPLDKMAEFSFGRNDSWYLSLV